MFINGLCNKERMILRCLAVETKVIKGKFSKLMSYIVFSFTLKGKFFLVRLPDACRKFSLGSKKIKCPSQSLKISLSLTKLHLFRLFLSILKHLFVIHPDKYCLVSSSPLG